MTGNDEPRPGVDAGVDDDDRARRGRFFQSVRTILLSILIALAVRVGIAQAYVIDGPSMEPTLTQGERVLVARYAYGLSLPGITEAVVTWGLPDVGDVVIVQSPVDELDLIKRVVGLPGDVIEIRNDVVYRNGQAMSRTGPDRCTPERFDMLEPACETFSEGTGERIWKISRSAVEAPQSVPPSRVPAGHVYVLGDHRDRSNDSRAFGPVAVSRLRGEAVFVD